MPVVRATAELDVLGRGCTSRCVRRDVMELEERGFAASASPSDERAAFLIATPNRTPDSRRYVTSRRSGLARAWSRRRYKGKPAPLEIVDQQRQRAIEDRTDVFTRQRMSCKGLRAPQLFVRLSRQRHL